MIGGGWSAICYITYLHGFPYLHLNRPLHGAGWKRRSKGTGVHVIGDIKKNKFFNLALCFAWKLSDIMFILSITFRVLAQILYITIRLPSGDRVPNRKVRAGLLLGEQISPWLSSFNVSCKRLKSGQKCRSNGSCLKIQRFHAVIFLFVYLNLT